MASDSSMDIVVSREEKILAFWELWKKGASSNDLILEDAVIDEKNAIAINGQRSKTCILLIRCSLESPINTKGNIVLCDCKVNSAISCHQLVHISTEQKYGILREVKCTHVQQLCYGWKPVVQNMKSCNIGKLTSTDIPVVQLQDSNIDELMVGKHTAVRSNNVVGCITRED
jgi:hypothetical protein